jgi:Raf kinase inhibitor-like YbhB/YbcL family protein
LAALLVAGLTGCPSEAEKPEGSTPAGVSKTPEDLTPEGVEPAKIDLSSPAFEPGEPIPVKHTEDGDDRSPPLSWSGVPEGTQELALICDDPDAPSPENPGPEPWVHWVLYKIPADCTQLPENVAKTAQVDEPAGALQGKNSWPEGQTIGFRGPAPPKGSGTHRYVFKLYALDAELNVAPEADKAALVDAMRGHVIGRGELIGTYAR